MTRSWKRKRLLIDRLQLTLLGTNLVYMSALLLIFAAILFGPLVLTLYDDDASLDDRSAAAASLLSLHKHVWPPLFVVTLAFLYHSAIQSHRIAGPLYRIRLVLERVRQGDLSARAHIRSRDYLRREVRVLNEALESTAGRLERAAGAVAQARGVAASLRSSQAADGAGLLAVIERLEVHLDSASGQIADVPSAPRPDVAVSETAG